MRSVRWTAALLWVLAMLVVAAQFSTSGEKKPGTPVRITVTVPRSDAKLYIFDSLTAKTGTERAFESSPLEPGKYYYEFKVMWEPNNYTKIYRTKRVYVEPGKDYKIDLTVPNPEIADDIKVRYVPTPDEVVEEMLKVGKVGKDDVVFDLGCGDGRMVIDAIKKYGAKRGVGVDIDPERIKDSNERAKMFGVTDKVQFREGDVLKKVDDLADASVVLLYMGNDINLRLRPILKSTLKPGSRVVSHRFTMGDWKPDKSVTVKVDDIDYEVHLWNITDKTKDSEKAPEKTPDEAKKEEK